MATLLNPLDEFSTYSVHYVMLACRTTVDAQAFTNEANNSATLAAIEEVNLLGEAIPYGNKETAYLVMDTRRFSQFSIDSLKYEVLINGLENKQAPGNLASMIEMTILDSVGISFINFLQWLMDEKMQCNFDGVIYMLRVVFVGQKPDGTTETVQTVTIPMHLFKLELNLDYAKGVYTAEFMPNMNFDTMKHNRWVNISAVTSYFTGAGNNTLGALVDNFQKQLNEESLNFYQQANKIVETNKSVKKQKSNKFGRLVQYMITIPDEWRKFIFTGAATAAASETIFKKQKEAKEAAEKTKTTPGTPQDSNFSVEIGMTIPETLDLMFRQVTDIADLATGRKKDGMITFYNHFVGITSSDDVLVVHVDVVEFKVPDVLIQKEGERNANVSQNEADFYQMIDGKRVPKNYAEFDFIYTGKNKDILSFDMKLQDLQMLLAFNLNVGAGAMAGVAANGQNEKDADYVRRTSELVQSRAYDPLLLPLNSKKELENFSNYSSLLQTEKGPEMMRASQERTSNLSMFYAASPIIAQMTIRGNPAIMTKFNQSSFLPHFTPATASSTGTSKTNTNVQSVYRKMFEDEIIRNNKNQNGQETIVRDAGGGLRVSASLGQTSYTASPVFVKVNIMGPNVNFVTSELVRGEDFSKAILYDNYYVVMKVTNIIEAGSFRQELELYSHNVFGQGKITGAEKAPPKV